MTTIGGVTLDLTQTAPVASTSGWTRDECSKLANEGLVKFKETVTKKVLKTPLSANLSVSSYKPSEMDSKNNFFYALGQWSTAALVLQSFMKTHCLASVFTIIRVETTVSGTTTTKSVASVGDLFADWHSMTIDDVFHSCDTYMKYSDSAIDAQNLNLTWELLLANVDQDLKASVIAEVSRFISTSIDAAHSGPMAFYVIANRIVRSSDALAHHAVSGLMLMGLVHFKGEDVEKSHNWSPLGCSANAIGMCPSHIPGYLGAGHQISPLRRRCDATFIGSGRLAKVRNGDGKVREISPKWGAIVKSFAPEPQLPQNRCESCPCSLCIL